VRLLLIDELSATELSLLRGICERVVVRIESTSGSPRQNTRARGPASR
jgi:hypothetical protein